MKLQLIILGRIRFAFDAMVRYRIAPPKPDPDIVIVDIDEASLAAMDTDYGRWPWPRQVLGEFLENIEKQQPKAMVFDILLSDADVFNPDSDAYFDAAIAKTNNTFFPMLLLDPSTDATSEIKAAQIPGVTPLPDEEPEQDATVGVVLPHFQAALAGVRLGTHNDGGFRRRAAQLSGVLRRLCLRSRGAVHAPSAGRSPATCWWRRRWSRTLGCRST